MASAIGCADPSNVGLAPTALGPSISNSAHDHSEAETGKQFVPIVRDLGTILADGEPIIHDFDIANDGKKPLRLVTVEAMTPCCSGVERFSDSIGPGETGRVRVALRPGFETGRKGVSFVVHTDPPTEPDRLLRLEVDLVSAWSVSLGKSDTSLPLGQSGVQRFVTKAVRGSGGGRDLPERFTVAAPLRLLMAGPAKTWVDDGGLTHGRRELSIEISASTEVGTKHGAIDFEWKDGRRQSWPINWRVTPVVEVSPSAFILMATADPARRTVIVHGDRPFRLTGLSGARPTEDSSLPTPERLLHVLDLELDAAEPGFRDVSIATDHPAQRVLSISLQVRAGRGGES